MLFSFTPTAEPQPLSAVFTFQALPIPTRPLQFKRKQTVRLATKRSRPIADVDDALSASKKKRRLRLHLITSRLSQPFSTPATHIVDPGTSKIAVWAKQRHLTQQLLRKAAIMNRVRRKTLERKDSGISVGEDERREAREKVLEGVKIREVVAAGLGPNAVQSVRDSGGWDHSASPLGLSNYDALDDEDDWYDSYHEEGEDEDGKPYEGSSLSPRSRRVTAMSEKTHEKAYYADWNLRDAEDDDEMDDEGYSNGLLESLPVELGLEMRPPSPPEGAMVELLKEQEREQEIMSGFRCFV